MTQILMHIMIIRYEKIEYKSLRQLLHDCLPLGGLAGLPRHLLRLLHPRRRQEKEHRTLHSRLPSVSEQEH